MSSSEEFELLPGECINLRLERVGVYFGSTCGMDPQGGHGSLLVTNYQVFRPQTPEIELCTLGRKSSSPAYRFRQSFSPSTGTSCNPIH